MMGDTKPTLGKGSPGQGFVKKPRANRIEVDADEVQRQAQGYEARIARQRVALDRMATLLEQRTQDVVDHMRRANEAARWAADNTDELTAIALTADQKAAIADDSRDDQERELNRLRMLVPADWDLYNEDDTEETILEGYIKYLQDAVKRHSQKETYWHDQFKRVETERNQAVSDANHALRAVNKAQAAMDIGDDTPPWEKNETPAQTFVQQAEHNHAQPGDEYAGIGESETLSWSGDNQLPGEERPGRP